MKTFSLSAQKREGKGKKAAKNLRREKLIPAVIYSADFNESITVSQESVRDLIYTPDIYLVELDLAGTAHKCIIQDIQFHPVTDQIIHIDFLKVYDDKPIVIDVPVKLEGHAIGVRAGGKLNSDMRKLRVKALYKDIPEKLVINVSKLELGKVIQVGDLSFENLELMNAKNNVVAAVRLTRAARGLAPGEGASSEEEEGEESEGGTEQASEENSSDE